jgi:hypothetical protein
MQTVPGISTTISTGLGYAQFVAGHELRRMDGGWIVGPLPNVVSPDMVSVVAELDPSTFLAVVIRKTHGVLHVAPASL